MSHRTRAYLFAITASVIWGVAGPIIKHTLAYFPPLLFLVYRLGISSIIAFLYFSITGFRFPKKSHAMALVVLYSFLAVTIGLGLLFFGFNKTTALSGVLLSTLSPLIVVLLSTLFLREHETRQERIGLTLALAGTLTTIFGPILFNGTKPFSLELGGVEGNLLIIASVVSDSIATLLVKVIYRKGVDTGALVNLAFMIGFFSLLPILLFSMPLADIGQALLAAPLQAHLGVLYMAVLSGSFAYVIWNKAIRMIEVSEVVVFSYLYPIWAAPLAIFWLKENLTLPFILGASLIGVGVLIAEHKRNKKKLTRKIKQSYPRRIRRR